jgi:formylglycine-generating enzyme required for sulfatase activity
MSSSHPFVLPASAPAPVGRSITDDMIWIPGGTFRMGSDLHYPEEAPAHRVNVSGFWIDRYPITNEQFRRSSRRRATSRSPRFRPIPPTTRERFRRCSSPGRSSSSPRSLP